MTELDSKTLLRLEEALGYYLKSLDRQKASEKDEMKRAQLTEDIAAVRALTEKVKKDFDEQSG